uniref:Reverse transcriptase zinc-binding domain-containing protein n=1 Tax=Arundo donax TaxID=35708 RepID=A0A0A9GGC5_ARUDO
MGYSWKVGDAKQIKFWEDNWLGSSSLAIQFWELYVLVNGKTATIAEIWDGMNLKCTFRRCVDERLMRMWEEVVQITTTIEFTGEEDGLVWQFHSSGVYSSQSLYRVINFRGTQPVYVPALWRIHIPPRVHFFLWLLSKNMC